MPPQDPPEPACDPATLPSLRRSTHSTRPPDRYGLSADPNPASPTSLILNQSPIPNLILEIWAAISLLRPAIILLWFFFYSKRSQPACNPRSSDLSHLNLQSDDQSLQLDDHIQQIRFSNLLLRSSIQILYNLALRNLSTHLKSTIRRPDPAVWRPQPADALLRSSLQAFQSSAIWSTMI